MFEHRTDEEIGRSTYVIAPKTMKTMKDIQTWDGYALRGIEEHEAAIKELKQYRMMLYERVQELETAAYTRRLKLIREPHWQGKKYYNVSVVKDYGGDIGEITELTERYPGNERSKAFKRFAELKKQYPGIDIVQDTEKRGWEK